MLIGFVAVAIVMSLVRVLRGPKTTAFDAPAMWNDGAAWPGLDIPPAEREIDLRSAAAAPTRSAEPPADVPPPTVPVPDLQHVAWVEPFEGECPPGYPIKAKLGSGIFHQPGGAMYGRTKPDRCYSSADEATADGLRPAKR